MYCMEGLVTSKTHRAIARQAANGSEVTDSSLLGWLAGSQMIRVDRDWVGAHPARRTSLRIPCCRGSS